MVVALLGLAASVALCASVQRTEVSLTASVFALWLALAPLLAVERRGAGGQAWFALACATPFAIVAAGSDRLCGAPWGSLGAQLVLGASWLVVVSAARARALGNGVEERWLTFWLALTCLASLAEVALALGGDGARWPLAEFLARASVLDWFARRVPLQASVDPATGAFWAGAVAPSLAVVLAWRSSGAPRQLDGVAHVG